MKVEELIELLKIYKEKYGDLPIYVAQEWGADYLLNRDYVLHMDATSAEPERFTIGY